MVRDKDRIFELAQKISQKRGLKKTIKEYQNILEKDPTNYKTRIKLGDIYLNRGDLSKAIEEYFQIGEYYISEELDLKAIAIFRKILVLNPEMIKAYYKIADLYRKRGLFGEAKIQYQKILEIDHNERMAREGLKNIDKKLSQNSTLGKKPIEDEMQEKDPVLNAILQELQHQLSSQLKSDDYQTHYQLGIAFKEMGLLQKAIEEFKTALMDPHLEFQSYLMLGMCNREMRKYNEAIDYLKKGTSIRGLSNNQYEHIYYQLGLTFEESGKKEEALAAFNRINELIGGASSSEIQLKVAKLKEQLRGR